MAQDRGDVTAAAGTRLNTNASTVFRVLQRIEKQLGQRLFDAANEPKQWLLSLIHI